MQKGRGTVREHRGWSSQLPEVIDSDVLAGMLDEDLITRLRLLEDEKNKLYEQHADGRPWEEEIAYVRREQQVRRGRRDAHQDYMRKVESELFWAESGLPAGDFDNSAYVYAATGGRPRWS